MSATGGISLQYFISIAIAGEVGSGSSPDHAAKNLRQKNEGNQINQPCNVPLVRIYKLHGYFLITMKSIQKNAVWIFIFAAFAYFVGHILYAILQSN